jgi:hypothetical protein
MLIQAELDGIPDVGGDTEGYQPLLHLLGIGEPEVLGRRDVTKVIGAGARRDACPHATRDMVMADGDIRGQRPRDEKGGTRMPPVASDVRRDPVCPDMPPYPFDDHLNAPFMGTPRECRVLCHLPFLCLIHPVVDAPAPHGIPEGKDDIVAFQDRENPVEVLEEGVLGPVLHHVGTGNGPALRDHPHDPFVPPQGPEEFSAHAMEDNGRYSLLHVAAKGGDDIFTGHGADADPGGRLVDGDGRDRELRHPEYPSPDIPDITPHGEVGQGIRTVFFGDDRLFQLLLGFGLQGRCTDIHIHLGPESPPDPKGLFSPQHDDGFPAGNMIEERPPFHPLGPGNRLHRPRQFPDLCLFKLRSHAQHLARLPCPSTKAADKELVQRHRTGISSLFIHPEKTRDGCEKSFSPCRESGDEVPLSPAHISSAPVAKPFP